MEPLKTKLKIDYFHKKLLLDSRRQTIDARRMALMTYSNKQSPQVAKVIIPEILELLKELESVSNLNDVHIVSNLFKRLDSLIARNFQHNAVVFEKTVEVIGLYLEKEEILKKSAELFAYSIETFRKNILNLIMSIVGHFVIDCKEMRNYILKSHVHSLLKLRLLDAGNIDVLNYSLWVLCAFIEDDSKHNKLNALNEYYSVFYHLLGHLKAAFEDSEADLSLKTLKRGSKIVESLISNAEADFSDASCVEVFYDNIHEMLIAVLRLIDNSDTLDPILFDKGFVDILIDLFVRTQNNLQLCNEFIQVLSSYMSVVEHQEIIEYLMLTRRCLRLLCNKLLNPTVQNFVKEKILFTITNSMVNSEAVVVEFINHEGIVKQLEDFVFVYDNEKLTGEVVWCLGMMTNFNYTSTFEAFCTRKIDKLLLNTLARLSKSTDVVSLCVLLDALKNILATDQKIDGRITEAIKNSETIDILAELQLHKRRKVYDRVYDILIEYFEDII